MKYTKDSFLFADWVESHAAAFLDDYVANNTKDHSYRLLDHPLFHEIIIPTSIDAVQKFRASATNLDDLHAREMHVLEHIVEKNYNRSVYVDGWTTHPIRVYGHDIANTDGYPTARAAIDLFGPACVGLMYNTLRPQTTIPAHIDCENVNGNLINVHLPLSMESNMAYSIAGGVRSDMVVNELHFLETHIMHSAHNDSLTQDRVNVVFVFDKSAVFK